MGDYIFKCFYIFVYIPRSDTLWALSKEVNASTGQSLFLVKFRVSQRRTQRHAQKKIKIATRPYEELNLAPNLFANSFSFIGIYLNELAHRKVVLYPINYRGLVI